MINFNSNLKYLMTKYNINKNQLAQKLNGSRQNVQQIVNTLDPRASTIIKICEIFNVNIEDLLLKDLEKENK